MAPRAILISTLMVMLIPNTALVLPIFLEINAVHLVGSPLAVILPFAFFPFGVYLAYIYFSTSVSRELLDAARIDGAGEFAVFRQIALPLAIPVVALVGFFNFVTNWNNYFLPFVMFPGSKSMPIQVGLVELLANVREINPTTVASDSIPFPQLALATLISVAPVLIVVLVLTAIPRGGPHRRRDERSRPAIVERTQRSEWRPACFRTPETNTWQGSDAVWRPRRRRFQSGDARRAPSCPRLRDVFSHRSRGGVAVARGDRLADRAVLLERHLRCVVGGDARESTALASALEHDACDVGGEPESPIVP